MTPKQLKDTLARRAKIHDDIRHLAVTPVTVTKVLSKTAITERINKKWGTTYTRQRITQIINEMK
jgi:hypothetical protein